MARASFPSFIQLMDFPDNNFTRQTTGPVAGLNINAQMVPAIAGDIA
jgi:hypothetical protein